MLAAGSQGVQRGSEREVKGHQVLVGTDDPQEIQSELCQIQILDRQLELVLRDGNDNFFSTYPLIFSGINHNLQKNNCT